MRYTTTTAPDPVATAATDHRTGPRRRGVVLERAIFEATLSDLEAVGYARLTMDGVAHRARTGKTSLYLRWPGKADLVAAAVEHAVADQSEPPDTGTIRGDLLAAVTVIAARLDGAFGEAVRGLAAETLADPERTRRARESVVGWADRRVATVFDRAVRRGEIAAASVSPWAIRLAPVLVTHEYLAHGAPIPEAALADIVDQVVLPVVGVAPPPPAAA
jgi:AcrR family transcriptional regulator